MAARRLAPLAALLLAAACGQGSSLDQRLLRVATQGDRRKVNELLAKGAHVDAVDEDGWTPLLWAAAHGNEDTVIALLDAGASRQAVTRREQQGPLTLAAKWNRVEVVQTLLRRGLAPNQRDNIGWSALMWASLQGRTDVAGALLDGGASINFVDSDGNTPLILAARRGRLDTVKLLLARGARADVRNVDGETAKSLALADDYPDVAALLP
ncbi:MAG TPA: ankyrin repeat domain-containing protein [Elusimicrobiota bacterium]|nr:ankyrin repeat domain-containing protein [Elusimicrobiota bacterium]